MRTAIASFLMLLGPFGVLFVFAHLPRTINGGSALFWLAMVLAAGVGSLGVGIAPWSDKTKGVVAAIYVVLLLLSLPLQALIAACTTGDCL